SLCFLETTAVSLARTAELLTDGDKDFRLLIVQGSRYEFVSHAGVEQLSDGEAIVLSNSMAGTVRILGPCRLTAIRLPRSGLIAAARGIKESEIQRLAPSSKARRLLGRFIELVREEGPATDPALAHRLASHLLDLVALTLEPLKEADLAPSSAAVREARSARI